MLRIPRFEVNHSLGWSKWLLRVREVITIQMKCNENRSVHSFPSSCISNLANKGLFSVWLGSRQTAVRQLHRLRHRVQSTRVGRQEDRQAG